VTGAPVGRGVRAADLVALLTERSLLETRRMSESDELYVEDERLDPALASDVQVLARIHVVTDVTHGFATILRMGFGRRERAAREALAWRWAATSESGRRWMASRCGLESRRHADLLREIVGSGVAGVDGGG
jgi:hypothetical protein